jgi:hypothetical protein
MNIWEVVQKVIELYDEEKDDLLAFDYVSEDETRRGVVAIVKDYNDRPLFSFFLEEQWEMIEQTSLMANLPVKEVVRGIVSDLETVVFLKPEDYGF